MKYLLIFFVCLSVQLSRAQESSKVKAVLEFQEELNSSFRNSETSPLPAKDLEFFEALEFFPIDTSFYVVADFVRTPYETPFEMPTTTERKPLYVKYGEAYFNLKGKEFKLNLYQNIALTAETGYEDYLFLPFTDSTNGSGSYGGGRYIDMRVPVANKVIIDFNQAYNPYCAYNGEYSCPIPPEENDLDIPITAGVKDYKKSE